MKIRDVVIIALFALVCVWPKYAKALEFECAFIQDKYKNGKPNKASCSMLPEKVFSSALYTQDKSEHCKVEEVYSYEDLEDMIVDTNRKNVIWTKHFGLSDYGKQQMKESYIKKGMDEKEADVKVNFERKDLETFDIVSHVKSDTTIYYDEITKKLFTPEKKVPEHTLIIKNKRKLLYLYIPEASGNSIILEPAGIMDASWIGIRFGRCRKIN